MCKTAYYTDPSCGCRWLRVVRPCAPGMGFSTCPRFFDGVAKPQPPCFRAVPGSSFSPSSSSSSSRSGGAGAGAGAGRRNGSGKCPVHDLRGAYDRNEVRRVLDVRNGMRWGQGPNKDDVGVEFGCVVM